MLNKSEDEIYDSSHQQFIINLKIKQLTLKKCKYETTSIGISKTSADGPYFPQRSLFFLYVPTETNPTASYKTFRKQRREMPNIESFIV